MAKTGRYVFDLESDALLTDVTRCWLIRAKNLDTGEKLRWLEGDHGWKEVFDNARLLIGHNIIGFDFCVLRKLYGYVLPFDITVHDTLTMSQWLDYRRFDSKGHGMKVWGEYIKMHKGEFNDWKGGYSIEMDEYCENDVEVTAEMYNRLIAEFLALAHRYPQAAAALNAEHAAGMWVAEANLRGWPFDGKACLALFEEVEKEYNRIRDILEPELGWKTVPMDKEGGIPQVKYPRYKKDGEYYSDIAKFFNIPASSALLPKYSMVDGPYCRVEFVKRSLTSNQDVKWWLFQQNWVPTEYNQKFDPDTRRMVQTSPKITEDSLEFIGGKGQLYTQFAMLASRKGILSGWIQSMEEDETGQMRVYGDAMVIGTPSMRATHRIIVNVPTVDSKYGKEMRSMFTVPPGWRQIGADSSGNQLRGLCHYLGNDEYTSLVTSGDVHTYNMHIINALIADFGLPDVCSRGNAKRLLYALLFGCGNLKTSLYCLGRPKEDAGGFIKKGFLENVAGFGSTVKQLEKCWGGTRKLSSTKGGWIRGIGGNMIYLDSVNKALCYLLQACEKATTSCAILWLRRALYERQIPYQPLIYMHDEVQFMVPDEYAESAKLLGKQAFIEGPKMLGVHIMDGEAKIGMNWCDCH